MVTDFKTRCELVVIDVANDGSVKKAVKALKESLDAKGKRKLYGVVNNAGIASGSLENIFQVNVYGPHRVCTHLNHQDYHLIEKGGRIVNISSGSGPKYVSKQQKARKMQFVTPYQWQEIDRMLKNDLKASKGSKKKVDPSRMEDVYGMSKAYLNLVTMCLANEFKKLNIKVNACTPGFIATDLTKPIAEAAGKTQKAMGMKQPEDGVAVQKHLLFGELQAAGPQRMMGTGCFYGSDCKQSPFDEPRDPNAKAEPAKVIKLSGWDLNSPPYVPASARV